MTQSPSSVVIQEPPLQELNKKRSCAKRTCATGCGCIVLFLLASLLLLKFAAGPKKKTLKKIPTQVEAYIPLYDLDSLEHIYVTSGKDRNKAIETAAYIPKIILAPIFIAIENNANTTALEETSVWTELSEFVREPLTDQRDSLTMTWTDLIADPSFVYTYYVHKLEERGFTVVTEKTDGRVRHLTFSDGQVDGSLSIQDSGETTGTDYVELTLFTP